MSDVTLAAEAVARFMPDRCVILSPAAESKGTLSLGSMTVTFPAQVEVYSGPCLYQEAASSTEPNQGGGPVRMSESKVKLPANATGVSIGCVVVITASRSVPLIGAEFDVIRVGSRSRALSVTLTVRQRTGIPGPGAAA